MYKIQIRIDFLFQFKLGRKAAETARDINDAFGPRTTNKRVAQRWFKKFCNGDESLKDDHQTVTITFFWCNFGFVVELLRYPTTVPNVAGCRRGSTYHHVSQSAREMGRFYCVERA